MINFSVFSQGAAFSLAEGIEIPSYEVMTANEVIEIARLKEVASGKNMDDPLENIQFQIQIVGIVMRSRVGEEWSDRIVGRLPMPVLQKAFEFCSKQVIDSQPAEKVVPEKKTRKSSKGIAELVEIETVQEVA